jgi:UDPglucose 6-dehydrogenase
MSRIGWIGLGKLGLPCALAMSDCGHHVVGTDAKPVVREYLENKQLPYEEADVLEMWARGSQVSWRPAIGEVLRDSEIVFVAVQTPHAPEYEGINRTPSVRRDFDYTFLESVVKEIVAAAGHPITLVIVSTVLPGTMRRVVLSRTCQNPNIHTIYSPAFIAMGTAARDWRNPALVIAGTDNAAAYRELGKAHELMHATPITRMSIESAELCKVLYNTFIGMKIVFANTVMELAHKSGADCDEIADALCRATDRIVSPKYLRGGMGDGGGCHPRDNIALSWLAQRLDLSVDLFDSLMQARDSQTEWVGSLAVSIAQTANLPIRICGRSFKKNSKLEVGSPSRLLANLMEWDQATIWQEAEPTVPAVYLIGVNHDAYAYWKWPAGSIVLDPWGYIPDQTGVHVTRIGRKSGLNSASVRKS